MRIKHIALYVKDLEAAKDFFVKYFNAQPNDKYYNKKTGFASYFLSFEDGPRLEIMNKTEIEDRSKPLARTGYIHIAFSLGSKENVDRLTERLKKDGYKVISGPRTTGDGYYESAVSGIEGNALELNV